MFFSMSQNETSPYLIRVQTPYNNHDFEITAALVQFWKDHVQEVSDFQPHDVIRVDWFENGWKKKHIKNLCRRSDATADE